MSIKRKKGKEVKLKLVPLVDTIQTKKQCVALALTLNTACMEPVYNGRTWCKFHLRPCVDSYLLYKRFEHNFNDGPLLQKIHSGHLSSYDVSRWTTTKLIRVQTLALKMAQARQHCSDLSYAASIVDAAARRSHERVIKGCRRTSELLGAIVESRKNGFVEKENDFLNQHEEEENGDKEEGEEKEKECETISVVGGLLSPTSNLQDTNNNNNNNNKKSDTNNLDHILREMERNSVVPCRKMRHKIIEQTTKFISECGAVSGRAGTLSLAMHIPTTKQWRAITEKHPTSSFSFVYISTGTKGLVQTEVAPFPFGSFSLTFTTLRCGSDRPFCLFLPLPLQSALLHSSAWAAAWMEVEEKTQSLDFVLVNRHLRSVWKRRESLKAAAVEDGGPLYTLPLSNEWHSQMREVVEPELRLLAQKIVAEDDSHDLASALRLLVHVFLFRSACIICSYRLLCDYDEQDTEQDKTYLSKTTSILDPRIERERSRIEPMMQNFIDRHVREKMTALMQGGLSD